MSTTSTSSRSLALREEGASRAPSPDKVKAWLARHPRFVFYFTPTSGSWLNAVETFFSALTRRRLKRGSFRSIVDLQAAIHRYIESHNHDPKPFVWTADPDRILASVRRGHQTLETIHSVRPHSALGWLPSAPEVAIPLDSRPTMH